MEAQNFPAESAKGFVLLFHGYLWSLGYQMEQHPQWVGNQRKTKNQISTQQWSEDIQLKMALLT